MYASADESCSAARCCCSTSSLCADSSVDLVILVLATRSASSAFRVLRVSHTVAKSSKVLTPRSTSRYDVEPERYMAVARTSRRSCSETMRSLISAMVACASSTRAVASLYASIA